MPVAAPELPSVRDVAPPAAAIAAAVLAISSTGSMVVAAALLGIATRSRWSAAAALLAVAAVAVRFSTATFDDLAGIQSVLGAAGIVGPATGAASAWLAGAAVLLAVRSPGSSDGGGNIARFLPALGGGALAAAIAAGPGPGGGLDVRAGATVVAVVIGVALVSADRDARIARLRPAAATGAGVLAVVLAGWPA